MRLKIGDKVKIVAGNNKDKIGKVIDIDTNVCILPYRIDFGNDTRWFPDYAIELEKPEQEQIIIKSDGKIITAYMGKKQGKAICNDNDKFDLYIGAKLALNRLFDKEAKKLTIKDFKVGDKVRILSEKEIRKLIQESKEVVDFTRRMFEYCGKITTVNWVGIESVNLQNCGRWYWRPNMLEMLED